MKKKNVDGNFPLGIFQTKRKKKENEKRKCEKLTGFLFFFSFFFLSCCWFSRVEIFIMEWCSLYVFSIYIDSLLHLLPYYIFFHFDKNTWKLLIFLLFFFAFFYFCVFPLFYFLFCAIFFCDRKWVFFFVYY